MKKKLILLVVLPLCLVVLGILVIQIININKHKKQIASHKQNLPNFEFYDLDTNKVKQTDITNNSPVCLIYFDTDCEYCQAEAVNLHQNIKKLTGKVVMISANHPAQINLFKSKYQLINDTQINVLWDKDNRFRSWFDLKSIPSIFIYDRNHQLVKEYHGQVKIEAIAKYLL